MKEQKLVYAEKSAKPSIVMILFWILVGDFLACILYGIAMGAGGSIDRQMENAPIFLAELAAITAVLAILFYRIAGKRKTSISIYERTVIFSAPKVPMLEEDVPAEADCAQTDVPESEPEPNPEPNSEYAGDEDVPVKLENPYLRKKNPAREPGSSKSAERYQKPGKRIGKVTSDVPNSEVECAIGDLRSASRKGKNVTLIMENGDRYLFVRMAGAAQLVKVIEDKVSAEAAVK